MTESEARETLRKFGKRFAEVMFRPHFLFEALRNKGETPPEGVSITTELRYDEDTPWNGQD